MSLSSAHACNENVVVRKLDNGLTVTLERLPYLRSATAGVWIRTGSANERKAQCGISHFLEHLFFKGTKSRTARQIIEDVESRGGHLNAFTSREYTCIYAKTLDDHIATAIEVLADVVKNSTFRDLEKERNVILEEIASVEDVPEDYAYDLLARQMWPDHALGRPISGYQDTVSNIIVDDVRAYYEGWYRPRNIFFSIAGNFDENAVVGQVCREFGDLTPRRSRKGSKSPEFSRGVMNVERPITQNHLCVGFPGPSATDPERYTYDVLCSALGGGSTSRLFQRIREDEGLAYAIYSCHSAYVKAGTFSVYAAVAPENFGKTAALSFEEIRRFREEPMTQEELNTTREHMKGSMLMALEGTFNRMSRMARSMMFHRRYVSVEEVLDALDGVTVKDIQKVAADLFRPERCAMVVLGPANPDGTQEVML
ncbi:MAG: insulinase family protein [Nitrospiraceae bacterium]|nr:insulinase family protein [Nitrospiraceae bacterium]